MPIHCFQAEWIFSENTRYYRLTSIHSDRSVSMPCPLLSIFHIILHLGKCQPKSTQVVVHLSFLKSSKMTAYYLAG